MTAVHTDGSIQQLDCRFNPPQAVINTTHCSILIAPLALSLVAQTRALSLSSVIPLGWISAQTKRLPSVVHAALDPSNPDALAFQLADCSVGCFDLARKRVTHFAAAPIPGASLEQHEAGAAEC